MYVMHLIFGCGLFVLWRG